MNTSILWIVNTLFEHFISISIRMNLQLVNMSQVSEYKINSVIWKAWKDNVTYAYTTNERATLARATRVDTHSILVLGPSESAYPITPVEPLKPSLYDYFVISVYFVYFIFI